MIVVVEWKYEMVAEIDTRARDKVSTAGRMGSRNRADPLFFLRLCFDLRCFLLAMDAFRR
jgi:hypothetical protein